MLGRIISRSAGELPGGYWQSFRWMPHPELAMHVRRYNGYFQSPSQPVRRRELPSGEVALIISLGPHYQLIDPTTGGSLSIWSSLERRTRSRMPSSLGVMG
jgi:hypothetical protein